MGRLLDELDGTALARKRELEAKTMTLYEEKFQIFLGVALALLAIEMVVGERRRGAK